MTLQYKFDKKGLKNVPIAKYFVQFPLSYAKFKIFTRFKCNMIPWKGLGRDVKNVLSLAA